MLGSRKYVGKTRYCRNKIGMRRLDLASACAQENYDYLIVLEIRYSKDIPGVRRVSRGAKGARAPPALSNNDIHCIITFTTATK